MVTEKIKIGMKPSHPGQFVRVEILDALGLSIPQSAQILDVNEAILSELIDEKMPLSPEMAMRLELAFDVKADVLLQMQAWHDSFTIRRRATELNVTRYVPEQP